MAPPFLAFFYIMVAACYSEIVQRRRSGPPKLLPAGRGFGLLTLLLLGCATAVYVHGISAYWFATRAGVTIQSGWLAPSTLHRWSAATELRVSCFRSRGGSRNVRFGLTFGDGLEIDIADTQQDEFGKHFAELWTLIASVPVTDAPSNPGRACPNFILDFLAEKLP